MASKLDLDDDQLFTLMKFKQLVRDILQPYQDDRYLCRWLRAREWDADKAEKMFRASMEWRKQWETDTLVTWTPPEPIASHYPSGIIGLDREKHPVLVMPFGDMDIVGYIYSTSKQDLIRLTAKVLEETLAVARKNGTTEIIGIFDLDRINLRQFLWKPAIELVFTLLEMYEANYPEILKVCYIINAPKLFAMVYNMLKRVINENTQRKIRIISTDRKKWEPALQEHIELDVLPKYYGGNAVDEDGNPKCPSKIKPGTKIPKELYKKQLTEELSNNKDYITTVIKRGKKLSLEFMVIDEKCTLHYRFLTEGHDIRFGVTYTDEDEKEHVAIKSGRTASNVIDVNGTIPCQAPATYTVTFDNSYSMFRNKVIHYNIWISGSYQNATSNGSEDDVEGGRKIAAAN